MSECSCVPVQTGETSHVQEDSLSTKHPEVLGRIRHTWQSSSVFLRKELISYPFGGSKTEVDFSGSNCP